MLSVKLFGKFGVCQDGHRAQGFEARKPQELFCYLLLHQDRPQYRETLAERLWENNFNDQTKKYLRKALWQLQTFLNQSADSETEQLFLVEPEWIQINPAAPLWVDALAFERAYQSARGVPGRDLSKEQFNSLHGAQEYYSGDLFEGCYKDWCVHERVRFQDMYLALLDKLIGYTLKRGQHELGIEFGSKILAIDHARERTYRRLMRLYYLSGDRSGALRQFERCAAALRDELNVTPSKRTLALRERLLAEKALDEPPDSQAPQGGTGGRSLDLRTPGRDARQVRIKGLLVEMGRVYRKLAQEIENLSGDG